MEFAVAYVDAHFGARPRSRFVALIGDAELDEGNIWEAVSDPATDGLGDVLWIVDSFGQSGSVSDLYRAHDLDSGSIVNAALAALSLHYQ